MSPRLFLSCVAGFVICVSTTSPGFAQWRPASQPFQKPFRFLGAGWGTGYHWRTPGHDSSYYNPYSAHNSNRIANGGHWGSGNSYVPEYGRMQSQPQTRFEVPNYPSVEGEFQPVRKSGDDPKKAESKEEDFKSALESMSDEENAKKPLQEPTRKPTSDLPKEWPFELNRD